MTVCPPVCSCNVFSFLISGGDKFYPREYVVKVREVQVMVAC